MGLFVLLLCSFNLSVLCYKPVLQSCKALSHLKAISHGQQCWWREWRGNTLFSTRNWNQAGRVLWDREASRTKNAAAGLYLQGPVFLTLWLFCADMYPFGYLGIFLAHILHVKGIILCATKSLQWVSAHPSHQEKAEIPHTALSLSAESHTRNQVRLQIQHSAVVKQSNDGVFFWPNHGSVLQPPVFITNILSPKPDVVLIERLKAPFYTLF